MSVGYVIKVTRRLAENARRLADLDEVAVGVAQAHEAAYRFVARYYEYERVVPIRQFLEAISRTADLPNSNEQAWAMWEVWQTCVQETLDGAPFPELPAPWDS